ncbi:MAG: tetratricopeptide repeat protein, partial [Myxococcota bacterium]
MAAPAQAGADGAAARRLRLEGRLERLTGRLAPALAAVALLAACAAPAPPPAPEATPDAASATARESSLAATLGDLAARALAEGDLDAAGNRYERWARLDPRSAQARVGLARVAAARGEPEIARARFEEALELDPASAEAHLGLADLAPDAPAERDHLERALRASPNHPDVLARLAQVTGAAPRRATSLADALALAEAHPFDPRAQLDAGTRLADAGRSDDAAAHLEAVVALCDVDPDAAAAAVERLRRVAPAWQERRLLHVHVFLDEPLRRRPGWRFRQRRLWIELSAALDPVLGVRFAPVSFAPFDAAPAGATLESRLRGLVYQTGSGAQQALFAGFTAEPTPRRVGAKRGVAAYLGRHLFMRDAPDEPVGRVLAHEVMHVFGGIHVSDEVPSLMNPTGAASSIDPLNVAIARSMAGRRFGAGGQTRNVLPHVEVDDAIGAYERALRVNLAFRRTGLAELVGDAKTVGPRAYARIQQVTGLDSHMADVSSFVARLYWRSERRVRAVAMLELAAQLYGRQSPQGRAAWTQAEVLRRRL